MVSDSIPISTPNHHNNKNPTQISTTHQQQEQQQEEDEDSVQNSTTRALLPFSTESTTLLKHPKKKTTNRVLLISLVLTTLLSISLATAFASLLFSSYHSNPTSVNEFSRPLKKLKAPVVLLISTDGFRFGYQFKTDTPNIHRLISNGTEAELGLIPVFPTLTFPNHYSIITGLYPAYHGIVNNFFTDPNSVDYFTMSNHDPKWYLGEPLWETVVKNGLKAATYFWVGSEVKKGSWSCPKDLCMFYNWSVSFEERVDGVLSWFDLPDKEIPSFMTLYFSDPDTQGHKVGPDDPRITEAVGRVDQMIGRLINGLEERGVFEDVNVILLGDHGMVGTCDRKLIFLDDLAKWIDIPKEWVQSYSPLLAIRPPSDHSVKDVVDKMNEGLKSGDVDNGKHLRVYLKEDLPPRLHYTGSDRIAPIIGMIEEGYKVEQTRSRKQECGGAHGYDNALFSMRSIFVAHGPRFAKGRKVPSFQNVEVYNLVTKILDIEGASNNGTLTFPHSVLLPSR